MSAVLAAAVALQLAPLHLVPQLSAKSHVGLDTPEGAVCPTACELQVQAGKIELLYQRHDDDQPVKFSLELPARGATVEFRDPPFREAWELLGPANLFQGGLFYGVGAAMHDSAWKGFGLFSMGIGAVIVVVWLFSPPVRPPIQATDADGKRLEIRF